MGKIELASAIKARQERSRRRWFGLRVVLALCLGLACPIFFTITTEGEFVPRQYWSVAQAFGQVLAAVPDDYVPASAISLMGLLYFVQYTLYVITLLGGLAISALIYRRFVLH